MDTADKHLFMITDDLDDYIGHLDLSSPRYFFHRAGLDQIPAMLESHARSEDGDLTAIIITGNESIGEDAIQKIKGLAAGAIPNIPPLFLLFRKSGDAAGIRGSGSDIFSYYLPGPGSDGSVFTENLVLYIESLFIYQTHTERVDDFIVNTFKLHVDAEMIRKQNREIEELNHRLEELSKIDYLTNILNRRAFFDELEKERKRSLRFIWRAKKENTYPEKTADSLKIHSEPSGTIYDHYGKFACLMLDIDHFKEINDTRGHLVGDAVLQRIGEILKSKEFFRETDSAGRYGGEEFIILLPETSAANAKIAAVRLKDFLKNEPFEDREGKKFHITVSMGLTEFKSSDKTNDQIIQRADVALYHAKNNGRDQIAIYEELFPEECPGVDS